MGGNWSSSEWMNTTVLITAFGEDEDGELLLLDRSGVLLVFESVDAIFADGFESGNTSAWALVGP